MMQEEDNLADNDEENQLVLAVLLAMQAELDTDPKGLRYGHLANKNRYRITGHMLHFNDYYSQTHQTKIMIFTDDSGVEKSVHGHYAWCSRP